MSFDSKKSRPRPAFLMACCSLSVCLLAFHPAPSAVTRAERDAAAATTTTTAVTVAEPTSAVYLDTHTFASTVGGAAPWAWRKTNDGPRIRTDHRAYAEPSLPSRPRAGDKYSDAVFGTEIMRATDERDYPSPGCGTFYSQWPTFNADATRLLIRCGGSGDALIKAFDPAAFKLGRTLRRTPTLPGGVSLEWQGATWSRTDPDLIFVHVNYYNAGSRQTGMKVYTYRPSSDSFTLLKDFAPQLSPGRPDYLFEMHVDARDELFTFMHKRVGQSEPLFFIVWKKSADRVLLHVDNRSLDSNAAVPDKSGRFVYFPLNQTQPDGARHKIYDTQTGRWETLHWKAQDDPPSHGDVGTGTTVGRSPWSGGINFRQLSAPRKFSLIFDMKDARGVTDWSNDQHMTLYADDESWALLGTYDDPGEAAGETGAFEDELMQVATDGSGRVRRLLHTRTKVDNRSRRVGGVKQTAPCGRRRRAAAAETGAGHDEENLTDMSTLKKLKRATLRSLKTIGAFRVVQQSGWRRRRLLILAYHGVSLDDEHLWDGSMYMPAEMFRERMRLLRDSGATVLPLGEALARLYADDLPERSVALTFDDGAHDFAARAFPIIEEFGLPVTLYLTTFYSVYNRPVFDGFSSYLLWRGSGARLNLKGLTGQAIELNLSSDAERREAHAALRRFARERGLSAEEKDALLLSLSKQLKVDYDELIAKRMLHLLNPGEVKALSEAGVETTCDTGYASRESDGLLLPRFLDVSSLAPIEFEGWLTGVSAALPRRREGVGREAEAYGSDSARAGLAKA
ncbi:MAG: polysaccharide deacetylase family protein [Acidobacteria bacterium]|nr:polysaccharide deacetylase family protein [Acidobacteriota bacterium]